jgi:hypothetical protein
MKAIALAATSKKFRVYVCGGDYTEALVLTPEHGGVSIFGGFDCAGGEAGWTYTGAATKLHPSGGDPAVLIKGPAATISIEGFALEVDAATSAGASSVAALVRANSHLVLRRVTVTAGAGRDGARGPGGGAQTMTPASGTGHDGTSNYGGSFVPGGDKIDCVCAPSNSVTTGGNGGLVLSLAVKPGGAGLPGGGAPGAPAGGGGVGLAGGAALPIAATGTLANDGWRPTPGNAGGTGFPGGGGGGGAAIYYPDSTLGAGGGGGGCGGCGGLGGGGGGGAGGSIGIVAVDSDITLEDSTLSVSIGGTGGAGGDGNPGAPGSAGGNGTYPGAYAGGTGGNGGPGGRGGGGAGGISVGVVYRGDAPTIDAATQARIKTATPGGGGDGSTRGIDGIAAPTLKIE